MQTHYNAISYAIDGDKGRIVLEQDVPWRVGSCVSVKRGPTKGVERMNVVVTKVDGNSFEFDVPRSDHYFKRPDFSQGPVVVKG